MQLKYFDILYNFVFKGNMLLHEIKKNAIISLNKFYEVILKIKILIEEMFLWQCYPDKKLIPRDPVTMMQFGHAVK